MMRRSLMKRCATSTTAATKDLFTVGGPLVHGFKCLEVRDIPELNLVGYRLEHEKTKATYFHFSAVDRNNAFCIGFRTPAPNNRGTTHVLEHTVLCGSQKYPVRDPFFMMIRRTLSNYMNALTGADYTLYPFATTNPKDYSNLLSVYLDATLRPLLRAEDFLQEGHRLELQKDDATGQETDKVRHNGVVYNEMKGVVSDPARFFSQKLQEKTLPGTHYEYISGGNPPHILDMTHEELVQFHKTHYHPSNSVVMSYGSVDPTGPEGAMAKVDEYFSSFEESATKIKVPRLAKYHNGEMVLETTGPLDLFGNPTAQKRVAVATALPEELDTADNLVKMSVLSELLTSGPSSPMYKSLIESKIGTKYAPSTGYSYYLSTPMLSFGLEGIEESRAGVGAEVETIIDETLATVAKDGFDERRVEAVVFQEMLQQKHRDANYGIGIVTGLAAMALVKPHQNVLHFINTVPTLREIAKDHKGELLPLLSKAFVENKHKVRLTVSPDAKFIEKANAPIEASEAKLTAEMTKEEKELLSKNTAAWLERVRAPTDGSCLPSLSASDIPRKGFEEPVPVPVGRRLFHLPYATNGLVYIHGFIPLAKATAEALLATTINGSDADTSILKNSLLHSFCGRTGAGKLDYKELSVAFDQCMSGFSLSPTLDNTQVNSNEFAAGCTFSFYTVKEKVEEAMGLVRMVLQEPHTNADAITDRIDVLTTSRASSLARAIQHQGNTYAMLRAASKTSVPMYLKELRGGIKQVAYSTQLLSMDASAKKQYMESTVAEYGAFAKQVAGRMGNALVYFTCEQQDAKDVTAIMTKFQQAFTASADIIETAPDWLVFASKDTALVESIAEKIPLQLDTSFAASVLPHDFPFSSAEMQKLRVACKILSNEFLHRKIREEGGAYGAGCNGNLLGTAAGIGFSSYRDPTPDKSLAAFTEAPQWLSEGANITDERIEQAKLTLFAKIDAPQSPDAFGYEYLLNKLTPELNQQVRDQILSVTREDVHAVAKLFDFSSRKASSVAITPNGTAPAEEAGVEGAE